jgi:DNA-binding MarR family transcriptional regulator
MPVRAAKTYEADLATALAFASRRVNAKMSSVVSEEGLTFEQWSVLDFVTRSDSPVTMSEIAGELGLSGPSLTRAADKLVTAALIFREVHPDDRRRVLVHASKRGQEVHTRLRPRMAGAEREIVADVSKVKELFETLGRLGR